MMLLFCGSWISIQSDWKASSDTFSMTVYFRESLIYKPTPPEARGVGTVIFENISWYAWIKIHFFTNDYFSF